MPSGVRIPLPAPDRSIEDVRTFPASFCYYKDMSKIALILLSLVIGLGITFGSLVINRKTDWPHCPPQQLTEVRKGFPLAYVHLKPSGSNCWSVEPISIFWKGGAFHEQYPLNFLLDFVFWSGMSFAGLAIIWHTTRKQ